MARGLPTYVRRDSFTGPAASARARIPGRFASRVSTMLSLTGGSREHYFHFLIGYLLPLVHAQSRNRFDRFQVLDCGPLMTPILEQTLAFLGHDFDVVADNSISQAFFVETWDRLEVPWTSPESVRSAAGLVAEAWLDQVCGRTDCTRSKNLLLRRSYEHGYYLSGSAQIPGYGISRRGITNLDEVSGLLKGMGVQHSVYEPGAHSLGCQIATFGAAERILGMRGAEWANAVWCGQSAPRVRILDPDPPAHLISGLMGQLRIRTEFAVADAPHAPEDPREALRFFTAP
jgi:hypothetical protein